MKKKFLFFVLVIATMLALCVAAQAADITVSFLDSRDPTSTTTTLDKTAHPDGKVVVEAGTSFTLPTTSKVAHTGEAGYQLIWYAEDGRTYKGGESVSFDKDTRLYRCVAKEVYAAGELSGAINGDTKAAILMTDLDLTSKIGTTGRDQCVLVLNGHTINYNANSHFMGTQRAGKHIVGEGTINLATTNTKKASYSIFDACSHGYDGVQNKQTIGRDVVVNAPDFTLIVDGDGSYNGGYPWVRVFGKINVYSLGVMWSGNRSPRIEIFESADVTITGPCIYTDTSGNYMNSQQLQLTIYGGTFTLPESAVNYGFWTNDIYDKNVHTTDKITTVTMANADKILVYGGTFNVKLPDIVLGAYGYAIEYDEATGTSTVIQKACTGGEHNFVMAEAFNGLERDCVTVGFYYYRCECGVYRVGATEELGHSYTILTTEKEATVSELGVRRVTCDRCANSYTYEYSFSPLDVEVTITVVTDGAEREVTLLAKDVFDFTVVDTTEEYTCSITGVKDGEGYTKKDIVKLQIPSGIITVKGNAISDMTALKEIRMLDYASVIFENSSIKNCAALEKMTASTSVVFKNRTVSNCPNFALIDVTKGNATFENDSFRDNGAIKEILMAAGNTYTFGTNCFYNSGLTQVIFPDDSNVVFSGEACFYGSPNLTYAYFGKNCIADNRLMNKPFDCCYSLTKVVLMDIVYVDKYVFCCNGNASSNASHREGNGLNKGPLTVYSHNPEITFNNDTFVNRGVLGVLLYTASATKSLNNCAYTIYSGLPHAYNYDVVTESTCVTEGTAYYVTDCPCGEDYRTSEYTTYSTLNAEINEVVNAPLGTEIVKLPLSEEHTDSDIVKDVEYRNGMTQNGTKIFKCLYCDVTVREESEPTFDAIFTYYGYSVSTYGTFSMSQSYGINRTVYAEYVEITGREVSYGVAAAVKANVPSGELVDANGEALGEKIIACNCVNAKYDTIDVRIIGLDAYQDTEIYICGYYIVGGKVYYIDNGLSNLEAAQGTTYNKIVESIN